MSDSIVSSVLLSRIQAKSLVEKKPGRKNGSGKKAWWIESQDCFGKDGKKAWCLFLGLIYIMIYHDIKLTHYFIHLILKMCLVHIIYFSSTI